MKYLIFMFSLLAPPAFAFNDAFLPSLINELGTYSAFDCTEHNTALQIEELIRLSSENPLDPSLSEDDASRSDQFRDALTGYRNIQMARMLGEVVPAETCRAEISKVTQALMLMQEN